MKKIFWLIAFFLVSFLLTPSFVLAVTSTSTANTATISGTYPAPEGGGPINLPSDTTPPATVSNLSASSPTSASVTLSWTSPGDDGASGTASQYSIRYATSAITDVTWNSATAISNAPLPVVAGTNQSVIVSGLNSATTYYFALKTADEVPNWSGLSNVVSATTLPAGDVTPPIISNIQVTPNIASAQFTWQTNEATDTQVAYGLTAELGSINSDASLVLNHSLEIIGLKPNTKYFYVVRSTDVSGNQASGDLLNFTTLKDSNPPANVADLQDQAGDQTINLSWKNPTDSDLAGVLIRRSTTDFPENPTEGTKVYQGLNESFSDTGLTNNVLYYYTIFAYDTSENYSSGALASATPQAPFIPQCRDGLDNDNDGKIDFPDDLGCSSLNDNDETSPIVQTQCNDGLDNDGDGKIDYPADPSCASSADNDEADEAAPPPPVVLPPPGGGGTDVYQLYLSDFSFGLAKGKIMVVPAPKMSALVGAGFSIALAQEKSQKAIESIILNFANGSYLFIFNETTKQWQTEISAPRQPGIYQGDVLVNFYDKSTNVISWQLEALPYGQIFEKVAGEKKPMAGAKVSLLTSLALWPATDFGQLNPQITGPDGSFGFLVPAGKYILRVEKDGYRIEETNYFDSQGAVVNQSIELMLLPPRLKDVINPEASLLENAGNVAQNLGEQAVFTSKVVAHEAIKIVANPQVKAAAQDVAAPAVAGAAAAGTAASIGFAPFLNYLRFLFTQPALLFKRRRRRGWGVIYNSLTKLPVELMTIRLLSQEGRMIQSHVTDKEGRFAFFPAPGFYRLEINHPQFKFPSDFLGALKEDGSYLDIYHGEVIEVKEKGAIITVNVPLDPVGAERPIGRLLWQLTWRRLQHSLSIGSLVVAGIFLIWVPSWLTAGLAAVQVIFYFLFRRLALPPRPKSWGVIYDEKTRSPLYQAIARIFDKQYNKLLETQVADARGRYSFLVGRNEYYVTYEKNGYQKKQSEPIDLRQSPEPVAIVAVDTALPPVIPSKD